MRPFKGKICDDISEFESYLLSHAVVSNSGIADWGACAGGAKPGARSRRRARGSGEMSADGPRRTAIGALGRSWLSAIKWHRPCKVRFRQLRTCRRIGLGSMCQDLPWPPSARLRSPLTRPGETSQNAMQSGRPVDTTAECPAAAEESRTRSSHWNRLSTCFCSNRAKISRQLKRTVLTDSVVRVLCPASQSVSSPGREAARATGPDPLYN